MAVGDILTVRVVTGGDGPLVTNSFHYRVQSFGGTWLNVADRLATAWRDGVLSYYHLVRTETWHVKALMCDRAYGEYVWPVRRSFVPGGEVSLQDFVAELCGIVLEQRGVAFGTTRLRRITIPGLPEDHLRGNYWDEAYIFENPAMVNWLASMQATLSVGGGEPAEFIPVVLTERTPGGAVWARVQSQTWKTRVARRPARNPGAYPVHN